MKCSEIIEKLEQHSPKSFAESWDNVGLLAGRHEKEVASVFIALDASKEVIEEAVRQDADMIITHHPLIFSPLKRITNEDFIGERIVRLLRYDISYYALHTNFDVRGMADAAADNLELTDREVLYVTFEDDISTEGIGRCGKLKREMSLSECSQFVKKAFDIPDVKAYGDLEGNISKIAVCPGSGKSFVKNALELGCNALITGDIDYHTAIDAVAQDLYIIDAGHYGVEKLFIPYMRDFIKREIPSIKVYTDKIREPFVTL